MIWKTPDRHFLIANQPKRIQYHVGIPYDEWIKNATEFYKISQEGEVVLYYPYPTYNSLEEFMYIYYYVMIEKSLYKYFFEEKYGHRLKVSSCVCIENLHSAEDIDLPFPYEQLIAQGEEHLALSVPYSGFYNYTKIINY
jgi:hypothetical protein